MLEVMIESFFAQFDLLFKVKHVMPCCRCPTCFGGAIALVVGLGFVSQIVDGDIPNWQLL